MKEKLLTGGILLRADPMSMEIVDTYDLVRVQMQTDSVIQMAETLTEWIREAAEYDLADRINEAAFNNPILYRKFDHVMDFKPVPEIRECDIPF